MVFRGSFSSTIFTGQGLADFTRSRFLTPTCMVSLQPELPTGPNPIGISIVSLIACKDTSPHIRGVEMLDNTPLLDIKPYLPECDAYCEERTGWFPPGESRFSATQSDDRFTGHDVIKYSWLILIFDKIDLYISSSYLLMVMHPRNMYDPVHRSVITPGVMPESHVHGQCEWDCSGTPITCFFLQTVS